MRGVPDGSPGAPPPAEYRKRRPGRPTAPVPVGYGPRQLLARNLRALREARGWTLDEVCNRCLVGRKHLGAIEACLHDVRLDTLLRLADGFGVPVHDLLLPHPPQPAPPA